MGNYQSLLRNVPELRRSQQVHILYADNKPEEFSVKLNVLKIKFMPFTSLEILS
jgi:hypothetical protein